MAHPQQRSNALTRNPFLVALAAWLVPGGGYALLGQRARAMTAGIVVILLFAAGLLIGGVRVLEVPGYGDHGGVLQVVTDGNNRIDRIVEDPPASSAVIGPVMRVHPVEEIRNKPWSIAQLMAGPIAVAGGAWSVWASEPDRKTGEPRGARSHARTNEIGVLYTAVAGMLNLLAIIDSGYRASHDEDADEVSHPEPVAGAAEGGAK